MFCIYKDGAVEKTFRGELRNDQGTFPAAYLRATIKDGTGPADVYFFEDRSKHGIDEHHNMGPASDNLDGNTVIRTSTPVMKNVDAIKARKSAQVTQQRSQVELGGIYWEDGADKYVVDTSEASQGRLAHATAHGNESGKPDRKWSLVTETGVGGDTWTPGRPTLLMAKFKQMAVAVGDHVDACFDAEEAHLAAIAALGTAQEAYDYDITTGWPTNPIHPDNREV